MIKTIPFLFHPCQLAAPPSAELKTAYKRMGPHLLVRVWDRLQFWKHDPDNPGGPLASATIFANALPEIIAKSDLPSEVLDVWNEKK